MNAILNPALKRTAMLGLSVAVLAKPAYGQRRDSPLYGLHVAQTFVRLEGSPAITADSEIFRNKLQLALRHEGVRVDDPTSVPPGVVEYACMMADVAAITGGKLSMLYSCELTVYRRVIVTDISGTGPGLLAPVWRSRSVLSDFAGVSELRKTLLDDLSQRTDRLMNDWLAANRP
jgi:hypothetical protein